MTILPGTIFLYNNFRFLVRIIIFFCWILIIFVRATIARHWWPSSFPFFGSPLFEKLVGIYWVILALLVFFFDLRHIQQIFLLAIFIYRFAWTFVYVEPYSLPVIHTPLPTLIHLLNYQIRTTKSSFLWLCRRLWLFFLYWRFGFWRFCWRLFADWRRRLSIKLYFFSYHTCFESEHDIVVKFHGDNKEMAYEPVVYDD